MPNKSPRPSRLAGENTLMAAAAISFSLTFVAAGLAILFGLVPPVSVPGIASLDLAVLLLLVPLCALMLSILVEVVRLALSQGSLPGHSLVRTASAGRAWRPGTGEG